MLIIALALAVIGLAALVFAVVTSNALVAWVCIGASVLGVLLLIVDAVRERRQRDGGAADQTGQADRTEAFDADDEAADRAPDDEPEASFDDSAEAPGTDTAADPVDHPGDDTTDEDDR